MTDTGDTREIRWSDDFLIGIEELDFEHRRLIDDINRLHRELRTETDPERIADTLGHIHARMQSHFALEEHVMAAHKYPHLAEHKAEHERLLDDYTDFMTRFGDGRDTREHAAMEDVLRRWIVEHIVTNDRKMSLMVTASKRSRNKRDR
jgi:hemerythrin